MNLSIEMKRSRIDKWITDHPDEGHPHYWCGGTEMECEECNLDHSMTELHLAMLDEERELLRW